MLEFLFKRFFSRTFTITTGKNMYLYMKNKHPSDGYRIKVLQKRRIHYRSATEVLPPPPRKYNRFIKGIFMLFISMLNIIII